MLICPLLLLAAYLAGHITADELDLFAARFVLILAALSWLVLSVVQGWWW